MKLNKPMSGEIYLNGKDYKYNDIKIGYVSQKISLLNSSIIKNIAFGQSESLIDKQKVLDVIDDSELNEFIERSKEVSIQLLVKMGQKNFRRSNPKNRYC